MRRGYSIAKRGLDLLLASAALLVLAPVILVVAVAVRVALGGPVLFRQQRPGLDERPFSIIKFRTMPEVHDASGRPLSDAERLSSFGRILRATSLDELPELWNVVRGDMSLVGPRPLLLEYLPLYSAGQRRRHEVRPGLTGWAQVNGRNVLSWRQKFEMDVWYVANANLLLDIRILFLTLINVLRRDGVNAPGEATMPRFTGSEEDEK